jgi:malonyl-CoA/methylmalonyl-CoA synthetase
MAWSTGMTLLSVLDAHAAARPQALALDDRSYQDLRLGARRVATGLRDLGVGPGDRVAIYAENSHGFVLAYLGALRAGAIAVPVNVLYRSGDLEHVLADSGARLVCVSAASAPFVPAGTPTLGLDRVVAWADAGRDADELPEPTDDDIALLIYTSGTTGRSKGAMLSHGNALAIAGAVVTAWRWTADDVLLLTLPLFHMHGLGAGLHGTLVAGGRLLLRERFDAGDVIATLGDPAAAVTLFFGVPTMYVRLLEQAPPGARFAGVRLFVSGSAALPATVHQRFAERFGATILERYGATEFGFALGNPIDGPRHAGAVGVPMPGMAVRIVDAAGADVAPGAVGEILVAGAGVFRGYWQNPAATAAAFVAGADGVRWYRSGDLGTFDPVRGHVITGRLKELIITGGFNVYPSEVEHELLQLPGVRAAAVIGAPHPARGEVPVAFVEADAGFAAGPALEVLRGRLASFKVPRAIEVVSELPRNAMGKVEKTRLRERLAG